MAGSLSDLYATSAPYSQGPAAAYPTPSAALATSQGESTIASGPAKSMQGLSVGNFAIPGWFVAVVAGFIVLRLLAEKGTGLGTV